ncbi:MAG TPA: hypothetical protein VK576_10865, partial [Thermoleophilia bacterium]|nr:hypothetical protein [Thermoleophilia bacterium]
VDVSPSSVRDTLAALTEDELVCYLGADLERGTITIQIAAHDERELREWVRSFLATVDGAGLIKTTLVRQVAKNSDHWPPPRGSSADPDGSA